MENEDNRTEDKRCSPGSKHELIVWNEPLVEEAGEDENSARYVVRIRSYRNRVTDKDNLCGKYFVDALRYAGIIPDDRPQDILYEGVKQIKVKTRKEEKTIVEVEDRHS